MKHLFFGSAGGPATVAAVVAALGLQQGADLGAVRAAFESLLASAGETQDPAPAGPTAPVNPAVVTQRAVAASMRAAIQKDEARRAHRMRGGR